MVGTETVDDKTVMGAVREMLDPVVLEDGIGTSVVVAPLDPDAVVETIDRDVTVRSLRCLEIL